ncbi:MAG: glycosyltransferase family 4 protein [Desulfuromonadaceae bacterium]|nr:glycosyltransferase family 4 protein [Desulfuromonadaceae bacterium]
MIFLVSELYYPEETSTGYILTKIAEGLAETFPVQVVTGPPDYSGLKASSKSEIRNRVRIERVGGLNLNKNKIASRVVRSIALSFKLAVKMLKMLKKGDTVLVVTNPAPLLVFMCLVCRVKRSSLVILVHDVFPENLQAAKLLQSDSIWCRILTRLFNTVYKSSSHIIVIGRDMKALMMRKINGNYPEITVITNWADTADIHPEERSSNRLIKNLQLESRFIVQFAGNIGRVQGIEQIVLAAEILKNENVHFIIIGNGAKKVWLVEQVAARQLTNITVLDTMPRSDQQHFLNACDVGLISLTSGMTGLGVPSKTYNILAAGKPVIAVVDPSSEVGLLVREEKVGWIVASADPEELASIIREASKFQGLCEMGRKSREIAESKYSHCKIIEKYREVLAHYESKQ